MPTLKLTIRMWVAHIMWTCSVLLGQLPCFWIQSMMFLLIFEGFHWKHGEKIGACDHRLQAGGELDQGHLQAWSCQVQHDPSGRCSIPHEKSGWYGWYSGWYREGWVGWQVGACKELLKLCELVYQVCFQGERWRTPKVVMLQTNICFSAILCCTQNISLYERVLLIIHTFLCFRICEKVNDQWEVCVSLSEGQFQQVSVVVFVSIISWCG